MAGNAIRMDEVEHGRSNNLNLIRLVLASLVVLSHSFAILGQEPAEPWHRFLHFGANLGDTAVFGFFFLSGLLILKSALPTADPLRFLRARLLRILPALAATVLLCTFVVGPIFGELSLRDYFQHPETWSYLRTILLERYVGDLPGLFKHLPWSSTNLPLWTLPLEWCMYMAALLTALLVRRKNLGAISRFSWVALIAAILFTAQTFPLELRYGYKAMFCFVVGGAAYLLRRRIPLYRWPVIALFLVDLALIRFVPVVGKAAFLPALFYLLLVIGYHPGFHAAWFHRFGDYSYGTYIYAWPIQQILSPHFHSPYMLFFCSYPIVLLVAAASWYLLESPCLALKGRATAVANPSPPLVAW